MRGWYGFDIDCTLARHQVGSGIESIGEPVDPVLRRLKEHLEKGDEVRIVTARVGCCGNFNEESQRSADEAFTAEQRALVEAWCLKHIGVRLPVTASKDWAMIRLYDDRVTAVEPNTGRMFSWGDPVCPCGRETP